MRFLNALSISTPHSFRGRRAVRQLVADLVFVAADDRKIGKPAQRGLRLLATNAKALLAHRGRARCRDSPSARLRRL
jgi:hypothetical protein